MKLGVIDVGTTTMRVAVVDQNLAVVDIETARVPNATPFPGLVEFDAAAMADTVIEIASRVFGRTPGGVAAVGVANQRASTVVWDRATGRPVGPGLGWQDLRTVMDCITLKADHDLALAPNQSATKLRWLLDNVAGARDGDVCFGTVDSWLTWKLSGGSAHVTDHTNAAVTGLTAAAGTAWNPQVLALLGVPEAMLPALVPASGVVGEAVRLPGAPPLAARVGDQQASLVGQGCVRPGPAKITFGTGGMLDLCTGADPPISARRSRHGTFPIVAWSSATETAWGLEAIMLSAGSNVDWLCEDLGLLAAPADSDAVARTVADTAGVVYVPALVGLGTPQWDYGARGTLFGVSRGVTAGHVVRAVLDGVAQRAVDLLEAAEADTGARIDEVRVDGGMSANPTFVQALADLSGRPVAVSPVVEATTLGAAFLAGLAVGVWASVDDGGALWRPAAVVEPGPVGRTAERAQWAVALQRAGQWIPELSALDF